MSRTRVLLLTLLAMIAFAGNSLLCRLALKNTSIDAATFTSARIASGALVLWLAVRLRDGTGVAAGSWGSALALFAYAIGFSLAYISVPAGTGALLLFSAVQVTMIGYGFWVGERLRGFQIAGFLLAIAGLVGLLLPGISAPPLLGSTLMLGAGIAWGVYSLRGKRAGNAIQATADNFLRALPFAILLSICMAPWASLDRAGLGYAIASGALASGGGYAIWYTVLKELKATDAATVQLIVPVIAAVGGIVFLGEAPTLRGVVASVAVLGGIALVIVNQQRQG